ncbi:MAG: class I SAM-dependent methyltransferase [Desulfobacterium sp.]|nr:class I SAM-dependent methyltransferase [Desulfobacterium sp.]MBU3946604.1 class I SAM-dependent methyltransferase [Pseudomonadota bacterium]MBU4037028.1 class I SAM-dependent methyltransferase [Pseudomonadota bacterium]
MFFPERIQSIKRSDNVLEIGPGGNPHPRSDILLEMEFDDEKEAEIQRSNTPPLITDKKIIYYNGTHFPFKSKEFDYVICSHVLEHVENIELFLNELVRVACRGYIEFPTIYYDYLYNVPTHKTMLIYKNGIIWYLPKENTPIAQSKPITDFFYKTLELRYSGIIQDLKQFFFQGFEWNEDIKFKKAERLEEITYNLMEINLHKKERKSIKKKLLLEFDRLLEKTKITKF